VNALFKQATEGDCNLPKPGMLAFAAKKEWESWTAKKGMSSKEASIAYIKLVKQLTE